MSIIVIDRAQLPATLDDTDAEALAAVAYGQEAVAQALVVEIARSDRPRHMPPGAAISSRVIAPAVPQAVADYEVETTDSWSGGHADNRETRKREQRP